MNSHTSTNNNMGSLREMNNLSHQQHQHQFNFRSATDDQPPINLPRPDLLGREDYNEILVPTYKATITGDWKAAKIILDRRPELVRCSITESCETVLHIAVLGKSYWFVEYLVSLMEKKDLELQNVNGQTALCLAAMAGHVKIAKILVKKNIALLDMPDSQGMMPLYMAALYGKHEMVKYLYHNSHKMTGDYWTHQNRVCVLVKSVESNLFDVALQIVTDCPELAINGSVLALLARKPYAFDAAQPNIIWRIKCSFFAVCHLKFGIPDMESDALQLLRIIWAEIVKLPRAQIDDIIRGPPDETKGDEKQTRSEKDQQETLLLLRTISDNIAKMPARIFNLFKGPSVENAATTGGSLRNLIITLEDTNGNNMLHLAGESAKINRLQNIPGVGLQLHLETLWFKQVEAILPPPFREKKNAAGLTPHEVFTKNHKILFSKGEEWMKETAAQLMVVASLIATITFAAAFTFPGGYDQVTGVD
nr:ankyrin repeat-containing domain, PGG domain protein [Tanacetum cinerariifolium]